MNCIDTLSTQETYSFQTQSTSIQSSPNEFYNILLADEKRCDISDCLSNHAILPAYRAKMIDWMIEVTT